MKLATFQMLTRAYLLYPPATEMPTDDKIELMAQVWAGEFQKAGCQPQHVAMMFDYARDTRHETGRESPFMPTCDDLLAEWRKGQPSADDVAAQASYKATQAMLDEPYGSREARLAEYARREWLELEQEAAQRLALLPGAHQ